MTFDRETEEKIEELADELYEGIAEDRDIVYFEGGIVRSVPTGAPPEYITVEIEAIYDENVMWRGVPASLVVGDGVLVWENPKTHRREIAGGSGASTTSTSSPWQKVTVAPSGGDFTLLSAAIAWINALAAPIAPSATRLFAVNMLGGTFVEAADVIIPQYVHVGGEGEGTVLDMGNATLVMSADSSLQEIVVTSTADDNWYVLYLNAADNAVVDDVRVIVTGSSGQQIAVDIYNSHNVELYHVVCESTQTTNWGFYIVWSTVLLWDCKASDTTNFEEGIRLGTAGLPSTATTMFCEFRARSAVNDVNVFANNTWNHFGCHFDPDNVTMNGTQVALQHGYTRFADKVYAGTFAAPVDVQVTEAGEYGVALYYSGNNYNVTGLRSRSFLVTTDAAARTVQAAKLQASNSDGIDAGVVQGAIIEAIGKSNATPSTITDMRGALVNTEWEAQETVTDLKTLYVRTHTRNSAVAGYISNTGYLLYLENEAVGGNGQMLDAAIYVKATNVSTPMAFDYGIDFTGATNEINTADILLSSGGTIGGVGGEGIEVSAAEAITLAGPSMTVPATWNLIGADNVADMLGINDAGGLEYMRINSQNANPYVIIDPASAGINFGIGTATPDETLEVIGLGRFTERIQTIGGAVPSTRGGVEFGHDVGNNRGFVESFEAATATYADFLLTAKTVQIWTGVAPAVRVQVDATGNLILSGPSMTAPATWNLIGADNVANMIGIDDAGGLEYMRINSQNANPYFLVDPGVAGINAGFGIAAPTVVMELFRATGASLLKLLGSVNANEGNYVQFGDTTNGNRSHFGHFNHAAVGNGADFAINSSGDIRLTAGNNSFTALTQVIVHANNNFGVGVPTPIGKIHVDQLSTTAAIPVAYFDQADVSEEMFEFNTTIGVGNAIEAVGGKTLTTTHFIKVTLPGALTRYFPVGTIA